MKTPDKNYKVVLDKNYVQWQAQMTAERNKFEKNRKSENGVYNWWIPFNEFGYSLDMVGLTVGR